MQHLASKPVRNGGFTEVFPLGVHDNGDMLLEVAELGKAPDVGACFSIPAEARAWLSFWTAPPLDQDAPATASGRLERLALEVADANPDLAERIRAEAMNVRRLERTVDIVVADVMDSMPVRRGNVVPFLGRGRQ